MESHFYRRAGFPAEGLCNCLMNTYGISDKHVIAANEGNAVGLAAGYHMATGKIPCVYLQNSGIGNIVNPVASLLNERVYQFRRCLLWAGEGSRALRMSRSTYSRAKSR